MGILEFKSQEQENLNAGKEYYDEESYDDFERGLDVHDIVMQRENKRDFLEGIVKKAMKLDDGYLLDAAFGRGLLL